jgi:hypothetical protein
MSGTAFHELVEKVQLGSESAFPKQEYDTRVARLNARANTYLRDIIGYDDADNPAKVVAQAVRSRCWSGKRIAIDGNSWFLTVNLYKQLCMELGELLDWSGHVEKHRRTKTAPASRPILRRGAID